MSDKRPGDFDRGKPYYPLVVSYLATIWSAKELAAIGLLRDPQFRRLVEAPKSEREQALSELDSATRQRVETLIAHPGEILPPLVLKSRAQKPLEIDFDLASELTANHSYLFNFVVSYAASGLLTSAWEATRKYSDQSPIWEFLRHCRHAAAHNGRFNFVNGEPRRMAKWRRFELQRNLHGTPLMHLPNQPGLLGPADPILLLSEIERKYKSISI